LRPGARLLLQQAGPGAGVSEIPRKAGRIVIAAGP
jgi:hypothetical protein